MCASVAVECFRGDRGGRARGTAAALRLTELRTNQLGRRARFARSEVPRWSSRRRSCWAWQAARRRRDSRSLSPETTTASVSPPTRPTSTMPSVNALSIGGVTTFAAGCIVSVIAGGVADSIEDHKQGLPLVGTSARRGPHRQRFEPRDRSGGQGRVRPPGCDRSRRSRHVDRRPRIQEEDVARDDVTQADEPELLVGAGSAGMRGSF